MGDFEKWLKESGFEHIKMWYQPVNVPVDNGSDYIRYLQKPGFKETVQKVGDDEKQKQVIEEIKEEYEKRNPEGTLDNFECTVVLAYKK